MEFSFSFNPRLLFMDDFYRDEIVHHVIIHSERTLQNHLVPHSHQMDMCGHYLTKFIDGLNIMMFPRQGPFNIHLMPFLRLKIIIFLAF